jgi:hypothetical protein
VRGQREVDCGTRRGGLRIAGLLPFAGHLSREKGDWRIASAGLVEGFEQLVAELELRRRFILTERSGLRAARRTLAEIADDFGITRSRVQGIEAKVFTSLRRRAWAREVARRVEAALEGREAVSLSELAADAWWSAAARNPNVAHYIVEDALEHGPPGLIVDAKFSRRKGYLIGTQRVPHGHRRMRSMVPRFRMGCQFTSELVCVVSRFLDGRRARAFTALRRPRRSSRYRRAPRPT